PTFSMTPAKWSGQHPKQRLHDTPWSEVCRPALLPGRAGENRHGPMGDRENTTGALRTLKLPFTILWLTGLSAKAYVAGN
ncbi:MAG TPA: hypothetical protein VN203_22880, partial [Candidatus Acidoferrum sp.]|nr:hypothetical protein [Candidatus Acidoferrum sp.]